MASLKFTVDSALLSELGEKLVETVHLALVELVKNSYDADATMVIVEFTENENSEPEIRIIDDGIGMNFHEVENYWMRIATTNKAKNNLSRIYGRPKTGAKGIGRFCCRRLGKKLQLTTVGKEISHNGKLQKTEVEFPWVNFKPGTNVTEIDCPGKKTVLNKGQTSTTLIISQLVDEWTVRGFNYLKRQLAVLVGNQGAQRQGFQEDPGFNIIIQAPDFEGGIRDLREDYINAGWGTLSAYINKKHQAVCELNALDIGRKTLTSKKEFPHLRDINLKLGVIVQQKDQIRNKDVMSLSNLKQILPEWGGVQVRCKGVRVFPYGDDDWLDIDRDRGLRKLSPKDELKTFAESLEGINPGRALLSMLSMKNYVGNVEIGFESDGFELKLNREGFINSQAFEELRQFVRFAIDWANICREFYIRKKAKENEEAARAYLEEVLEENIEPGKTVESAVKYLKNQVNSIASILPRTEKKDFEKSFSIATEAILKHEFSNQEELRHLRLVASTSTLLLIFSHEVKSLLGLLESNQSSLAIIESKLSGEDRDRVTQIRSDIKETKTRFTELLDMTSLIGMDSRKTKPHQLALRDRLEQAEKIYQLVINKYQIKFDYDQVANNIVVKSIYEAELYAILLNILSNSIKSVIAAGREKEIQINASRKNGNTLISIRDTGIGLDPSHFEDVFKPFFSDPENQLYTHLDERLNPEDLYIVGTGSGLGLSIVKAIILARKGSISFCNPRGKWKTELEIVLP